RVLVGVQARGAVERVVLFEIEFELEAGAVGARQRLEAEVIEVVVGVVQAEDGEILGRLEDAGDGDAGLGGIVERDGGGPAGEALDVHVPVRVEDVEWLSGHYVLK